MRTQDKPRTSSAGSRIAAERAEIQRLISKLQRTRAAGGERGRDAALRAAPRAAVGLREPRRHPAEPPRAGERHPPALSEQATQAVGSAVEERLAPWYEELEQLRALRRALEERSPFSRVEAQLETLGAKLASLEVRLDGRRPSRPAQAAAASGSHILAGSIASDLLSDILQLVSSNTMSGTFVVESEGSTVSLYFEEGNICHAEGPDTQGESAFFMAFAFETGRYYFDEPSGPPPARTISNGTQFLILEALRQIDERANAEQ